MATLHLSVCLAQVDVVSPRDSKALISSADIGDSVHSIELPHFEPDLPIAPGRDEYMVACVGCHSPRYVTMQPPLSQRQWEDTVDKMTKVYGAQVDPDQRKSILGYLVAIHGPNMTVEESNSRDDDFDSAPPSIVPRPPETAPSLKLSGAAAERDADTSRGAELFAQNCSGCHGSTGQGDGMVSQVLWRRPKNLAATRFSLQLLSQVLWNGKRGTAMPSWRSLPPRDLVALAAYVQSLHRPAEPQRASPESLQQGGKVFLQNCAPCHGEAGDGTGAVAATLLPQPANFKLKRPDSDYIQQVLKEGIPGTAMPSWKDQISESDRKALSAFVRSLFEAAD